MGLYNNLTTLFNDIASAIRLKNGSNDPIAANSFPAAIANITTEDTLYNYIQSGYSSSTLFFSGTDIVANVFAGNTQITDIEAPNVNTIHQGAFRAIIRPNFTFETPVLTSANFSSIISIGYEAFFGCSQLTQFKGTIETIGDLAFYDCTSLQEIDFTATKHIGGGAFASTAINTVNGPNISFIGNAAFQNCRSLYSVSCPNLNSIETSTFQNCTSLSFISCPNVTTIAPSTFGSCYNLTTIYLPAVAQIPDNCFVTTKITSAYFPSAHSIGVRAFYGNQYLSYVALASSCNTIGNHAFTDCYTLESFPMLSLTSFGNYVFQNCSSLQSISLTIPALTYGCFQSCSNLSNAVFTLTSQAAIINEYCFENCSNLTDISIYGSQSYLEIYAFAFKNCINLTSFYHEQPSFYAIRSSAFCKCGFSEISVTAKLIYSFAFAYCANLTKATFLYDSSNPVSSLWVHGCSSLSAIIFTCINDKTCSLSYNAFPSLSNLQYVILSSVYAIGRNAFQSCTNLKSLYLYNGNSQNGIVDLFDRSAFSYTLLASNLGEICVPKSLVNTYKSMTNWAAVTSRFFAIEDFPPPSEFTS